MTESDRQNGSPRKPGDKLRHRGSAQWADGLRKLYDSVVEEPLPDSFSDLLKKLDKSKDD